MKRPPVALVLVLVLVGFLLVVTGTATSVASQNEAPRKKALIDQILERRQDVDDRDLAVAQLRGDVAEAQDAASRRSANEQERVQGEKELAALAGTTAVKGRGLTVKLSDAPRSADAEPAKFDSSRIQDSDIQLVVNALFATGAEAIAVNDNRVVAVTPIRAAGGTIVVNYRPVSSPYRISAIGVDEKRFKSSDIVAQLEQWEDKFNLGFSIDDDGDMTIPAYAGRVGIDQRATPISTAASPAVPAGRS